MIRSIYHICEYGIVRSSDDYPSGITTFSELYLPKTSFENLYQYILESQVAFLDSDLPFLLYAKGGKRHIKVKSFVGLLETRDGVCIEILPKIQLTEQANQISQTKQIFLKMLRHLRNSPFVNIHQAHIDAKKDFPILEVFIRSFIAELKVLFAHGLKSDYLLVSSNLAYLKGKLKVSDNIKANFVNKAAFVCEYSQYSEDIAPNRIIKAAILFVLKKTKSQKNAQQLTWLLQNLDAVSKADRLEVEFSKIKVTSRLFREYEVCLKWCDLFLRRKGFTNFTGAHMNMAILFPMEKIFESYFGYLLSKYAQGYAVKSQDKSYFLVEKHLDVGKFRLKPDYFLRKEETETIIIDTKWKLIDENAFKSNYNISQQDMYQLYAYGKKYGKSKHPKLILVYPKNALFQHPLPNFTYEGDLSLDVIPFNLNDDEPGQIAKLLSHCFIEVS